MGRYEHVQKGHWAWVLHVVGLFVIACGFLTDVGFDERVAMGFVGGLLQVVGLGFWHLRVRDAGDRLEIVFGPLPLMRKRVPYGSIRGFAPGKTSVLDGWGVHWFPGRGWTWNLSGFDCVQLTTDQGRSLRVGTDDPEGLAAHLAERVPHAAPGARGGSGGGG